MITLLTDFGLRDTYVGQMKAVLASLAPQAALVDLTHDIAPQDVRAAALALDSAVGVCPPGTIHLAVVDPGVGSARRAVAVQAGGATFVGPDNGLLTLALRRAGDSRVRAVALTNAAYQRQPVSPTFHGRDIFAPAAGHLAAGLAMEQLGEPVDELVTLDLPRPWRIGEAAWQIHVLDIDHFGNIITDLPGDALPAGEPTFDIGPVRISGLSRTYADVAVGQPLAYVGSTGRVEVAVRDGSAAAALRLNVGDAIRCTG